MSSQFSLGFVLTFFSIFTFKTELSFAAPSGMKPILAAPIEPKMVEKKRVIPRGKSAKDLKDQKKEYVKQPLTKAQEKFNVQSRMERDAIAEFDKGNFQNAVKKYESLAKEFSGSKQGSAFDLRILDLFKSNYKKTSVPISYQKYLIKTEDKYKNDQVLGAENTASAKKVFNIIQRLHYDLVHQQIKNSLNMKSTKESRKVTLTCIDHYLGSAISDSEKELTRVSKGEIEFLNADHKSAAGTFAALATEKQGVKAEGYWRKAIRSQLILASWPEAAPWEKIPEGNSTQREVLLGMFGHITKEGDWNSISHIGLLNIKLGRSEDAYKLFTDTLAKAPSGSHAERAAGLLAYTFMAQKSWQRSEDLARIMVKNSLVGLYQKERFKGRDVLGLSLLEGGLEKYAGADYKTAVLKLDEFVKGWTDHKRIDQGYFHLAMAHQGAGNYRVALETMVNFSKSFPKSTYRKEALVNGGAWALGLAWEDHVMYFLEAHVLEFGRDSQALSSLDTLANLYMGREHFDAATRIMLIQLQNNKIDTDTKADIARRLLDMNEKQGSPASSEKVANLALSKFSNFPAIKASALSLKARLRINDSPAKLEQVAKELMAMDSGDKTVSEAQSEVRYFIAEALSRGAFDQEVYSLESKNPLADLNKSYNRYEKIRGAYEGACLNAGSSWCGPAMHRLARVSEEYVKNISPLEIPRTIEPSEVEAFKVRKKSILDTVEQRVLTTDERSVVEAKAGATNPDWTGAILWQNAADWNSERVTGETGNGYIQWHSADL